MLFRFVCSKRSMSCLMLLYIVFFLFIVSNETFININSEDRNGREKMIIDNDAGGDDAVAILLALLTEKHFNGPKVIGLTTVKGNTKESNVYINNQKILKLAQRQDVPIYRGCKSSLLNEFDSDTYFGVDGLGDSNETINDLTPAQKTNAVSALIELSMIHENKLSLITLGPLTNIAMAVRLDPDFIGRLNHLYIGAGNIQSEQYNIPEFNAHFDAEAYHIVVENANPDKVTVLPFSQVGIYLNISKTWRQEVLGKIDSEIVKAMNKYEQVPMKQSKSWVDLDPAVVAAAIKPTIVEDYQYYRNCIVLNGDRRGIVTNKLASKDGANVRVINKLKQEQYTQFLFSAFFAGKQ